MTRGRIKLKYKGRSDVQLTGNPKICFWKYVYKQHTNFAKQSNQIDYEDTNYMSNEECSVFRYRILRNAELVKFISLKLKLPHIYSQDGHLGEFSWIKNIGANIIEYARLYYDDILIEEIDGDFLIAHRDLMLTNDKITNFDKLIGNVPELYNPYQNNIYPSTQSTSLGDASGTKFYIKKDYNNNASIKEYLLNIPLLFCFFREKSFIPLVSNKLREVFVEIKLRPLKELYTIIKQTDITLNSPIKPSRLFLLDDTRYNYQTTSMILNEFPYINEQPSDTTFPLWVHMGKDDQLEPLVGTHPELNSYSISTNGVGDRVAVGIPGVIATTNASGCNASVKVYEYKKYIWTLLGNAITDIDKSLFGEPSHSEYDLSVSLNDAGDILAVGHSSTNSVSVYKYDGASWSALATSATIMESIDLSGQLPSVEKFRGKSVSLNNDGYRLAIGVPGATATTALSGAADVGQHLGLVTIHEYTPPLDFEWVMDMSGSDFTGLLVNGCAGQSLSFNENGSKLAVGIPGTDDVTGKVNIYTWGANNDMSSVTLPPPANVDNSWAVGWCVDLNSQGDKVAIAVRSRGGSGTDSSGIVLVYSLVDGIWVETGGPIYTQDVGTSLNSVSSISLSDDGTLLAIGYPYAGGGGNLNFTGGEVKVYKWYNNVWILYGESLNLGASDASAAFGTSVSLNSNASVDNGVPRLAVGAPGFNNGKGRVLVYKYESSAWVENAEVLGGMAHDGFGDGAGTEVSLSSDGLTMAVGFPRYGGIGTPLTGKVEIWQSSGVSWTKKGNRIVGPTNNCLAGFSLELDKTGDKVVIGMPNYMTDTNLNSGGILIYGYENNNWVKMTGGQQQGEYYGRSGWDVSIAGAGTKVASGLKFASLLPYKANSGGINIYSLNGTGGGWAQLGNAIRNTVLYGFSHPNFGWSVSMNGDGNRIGIGIPQSGKAATYQYANNEWTILNPVSDTGLDDVKWLGPGENYGKFGWSVSLNNEGDILAVGAPEATSATGVNISTQSGNLSGGATLVYTYPNTGHPAIFGPIVSTTGDKFGWSVSLNAIGDKLAVGYPSKNIPDTDSSGLPIPKNLSGGVSVFQNENGTWNTTTANDNMTSYITNDLIGHAVSLNNAGDIVAVGIPHISDKQGYVRVYKFWNKVIPSNYVPDTMAYKKRIADPNKNIYNFTKNLPENFFVPNLEVEYIYLDNVERKKFAIENLSQTFTFNKKLTFNNITGKQKLYINEFHPVKSLYIVSKRDDLSETNEWSNFSNNDYENQDIKNLQNYFTALAHKESLNHGDGNNDFIKNLGSFIKTKNPFNCIVQDGRLTNISGDILKLKGLDFLTSKPKLSLSNKSGVRYDIAYDLLLKYLLILNGGENYIKNPRIIDSNNRIIHSNVRLNNGIVQSVEIKEDVVYNDYTELQVESQLYCDDITLTNGGNKYTTLPNIFIKDGEILKKINYKGSIKNGRISDCSLLDKCIVTQRGELYVGGTLKDITFIPNRDIPPNLSIKFYDPYNKIVEPSLSLIGNAFKIISPGCGLSQHTEVCVGKIISQIHFPKSLKLKENIFDYEIVPVFYPLKSKNIKNEMKNTKKPILEIDYKPINKYDLEYKLVFSETYQITKTALTFNNSINNKCLGISVDINKAPMDLYSREIFLTFYTTFGPTIINLGTISNIDVLSVRIMHNLKYDVTNHFNTLDIKSIHCGSTLNKYITIGAKKTFKQSNIKELDVLTLFFNEKEISTVTIKEFKSILIGVDNSDPNFNDIKCYNNTLLFGNFTPEMYGLEFGKSISKIEFNNIDNIDDITLSNNNGFSVKLDTLHTKITKTDECRPIENIEYDFGGNKRPLHEYVSYEIINGLLASMEFNKNYYLSDYIWEGYSKSPIFILKNTNQRDRRLQLRDKLHPNMSMILEDAIDHNFQDALLEGIIDNGGRDFQGKVIDNNSGFNGNIELNKITNTEYDIKFSNLGYNYEDGLICTLISYQLINNELRDLNILGQYDVKINSIGQIDGNNQVLWKNNKPISKIQIIWDKNVNQYPHIVYNPLHNANTQYKLILGNIPSSNIIIINKGYGFSKECPELRYKNNTSETLFNTDFNYSTNIKNGSIQNISMDIYQINDFKVPLVGYTINNNNLTIKKIDYFLEPPRQLTGFKILDKGYNLNNDSRVYNGFITKLPSINPINTQQAFFTFDNCHIDLDIKGDKLEFRDEHKFLITNNNYNAALLEYANIKIDNKIKNNIASKIQYIPGVAEIKVIDKNTNITTVELLNPMPIFTQHSEAFFSTSIDDIKIIYPGNELDDRCDLYKLILKNANNEIIDLNNNTISVEFEGRNTTIRENHVNIDIVKDGGGCSALMDPLFVKSGGAELLSIMAINESKIENGLSEYGANELNLNIDNLDNNSELRHLAQNIYGWQSIDQSYLISHKDTIELDSIRKFADTWKYRDPSNIPILNKDNYNFYNSSNSIKSLGLSIDFKEREPPRDADYYRYLEKYFTMKNAVDSNILLYSFCLDNNRLQPNGNINLSSLNNLCLDLELKNPEKDTKGKETYKYNVSVFLKYYNIIDYVNGAGSLKYGN